MNIVIVGKRGIGLSNVLLFAQQHEVLKECQLKLCTRNLIGEN